MTLLPIRLGAIALIWQHPVFSNPMLPRFALTNVNFCSLLQASSSVAMITQEGSLNMPSVTRKVAKVTFWNKEGGKNKVVLTFVLSLAHLLATPQPWQSCCCCSSFRCLWVWPVEVVGTSWCFTSSMRPCKTRWPKDFLLPRCFTFLSFLERTCLCNLQNITCPFAEQKWEQEGRL